MVRSSYALSAAALLGSKIASGMRVAASTSAHLRICRPLTIPATRKPRNQRWLPGGGWRFRAFHRHGEPQEGHEGYPQGPQEVSQKLLTVTVDKESPPRTL